MNLNTESIIYSAGVGEDISFDLHLQSIYDCSIFLIDPTARSKVHYKEILNYFSTNNWKFSGNLQADYENSISRLDIDSSKLKYISFGLWDSIDELKFFKQKNQNNVSQSLINNMFSSDYDIVHTKTLKDIMEENHHSHIDLLKLDIEGAEVRVLKNMLDSKIYPKYLCIEFDLMLKGIDHGHETISIIDKLKNSGYKELKNDDLNITYIHQG